MWTHEDPNLSGPSVEAEEAAAQEEYLAEEAAAWADHDREQAVRDDRMLAEGKVPALCEDCGDPYYRALDRAPRFSDRCPPCRMLVCHVCEKRHEDVEEASDLTALGECPDCAGGAVAA
jgi:hypothetical protein